MDSKNFLTASQVSDFILIGWNLQISTEKLWKNVYYDKRDYVSSIYIPFSGQELHSLI